MYSYVDTSDIEVLIFNVAILSLYSSVSRQFECALPWPWRIKVSEWREERREAEIFTLVFVYSKLIKYKLLYCNLILGIY
jgi:hypothetical protein